MVNVDLTDKTAIIAGSTSGIGRAIAKEFAEHGATVVVNGRSPESGRETVSELEDIGAEASFECANINEYDQVSMMIDNALDKYGGIDIVVPNGAAAGAPVPNFFHETEPQELENWIESAYLNRLYIIKAALKPLIESDDGRVISLTADAGLVPTPAEVGPGGAGAALIMATRVLAHELSRWDITVNAVSLSVTKDTPAMQTIIENSPASHLFETALERQTFSVSPDNIAEIVTFLSGSDGAKPISGQIISVNGGVSFPR